MRRRCLSLSSKSCCIRACFPSKIVLRQCVFLEQALYPSSIADLDHLPILPGKVGMLCSCLAFRSSERGSERRRASVSGRPTPKAWGPRHLPRLPLTARLPKMLLASFDAPLRSENQRELPCRSLCFETRSLTGSGLPSTRRCSALKQRMQVGA